MTYLRSCSGCSAHILPSFRTRDKVYCPKCSDARKTELGVIAVGDWVVKRDEQYKSFPTEYRVIGRDGPKLTVRVALGPGEPFEQYVGVFVKIAPSYPGGI